MSKQNSVLKVKGALDGVSYYESKGRLLARRSKGPSKSQILNDPRYARTREAMAEFGAASQATKAFRDAFHKSVKRTADGKLGNRLTSIMKGVLKYDVDNLRGQRSILITAHTDSLENQEFKEVIPLKTVFAGSFEASINAARNVATVKITGFNPLSEAFPPPGTYHCRIFHAIGVVSNIKFNNETGKYKPVNTELNGTGAQVKSNLIPLFGGPSDLVLEVPLSGAPVVDADCSVIQCLGIEFYNVVGANEYPFAQNNAMRVIKVW